MKKITVFAAAIAFLFTAATATAQAKKQAPKQAQKDIKKATDPIPDKAVPYKGPAMIEKETSNTHAVTVKNKHKVRKAPIKSHNVKAEPVRK